MKVQIQTSPSNSIILIGDPKVGDLPESLNRSLVAATPSCIVVRTLCFADGKTAITLTDEPYGPQTDMALAYDAVLKTPSRRVTVSDVPGNQLLVLDVPKTSCRLRIWANDSSEPDRICIVTE